MGNPRLDLGATPELDGAREHLIVRSPVWLDAREVSVADFRASGLAVSLSPGGPSDNPHEAGTGIEHCTYTSAAGPNDSHPVNCISWSLAKKFCESRDGRLPTEAELEAAGSALGRSAYVWGADAPECGDAVFDRADPTDACATDGTGPLPSGSGVRDRLALPTGEVVDLAGNVREWALDRWNREDEPCWSAPILEDPRCEMPSVVDGDARATRGGHFDDVPALLQASVRSWLANEEQAVSALIGVRCARDD
jgi:formylglycine-generating enzyme required for sulfatase activity